MSPKKCPVIEASRHEPPLAQPLKRVRQRPRAYSYGLKPFAWALGLGVVWLLTSGCASDKNQLVKSVDPEFRQLSSTAEAPPTSYQRPGGRKHDSNFPTANSQVQASQGVVFLGSRSSTDAAKQVVHRFFLGIISGDLTQLEQTLAPGALHRLPNGRHNAATLWRQRLARLDYSKLNGATLYKTQELLVLRGDEFQQLGSSSQFKLPLIGTDVGLGVRMRVTSVEGAQVFGSELQFRLRMDSEGVYKIAEIEEDFRF